MGHAVWTAVVGTACLCSASAVGAQADSAGSTSENGWIPGFGVEGMLTHPFYGHQLIGFGVEYIHTNQKSSIGVPSENAFNLKFSIDYKLH